VDRGYSPVTPYNLLIVIVEIIYHPVVVLVCDTAPICHCRSHRHIDRVVFGFRTDRSDVGIAFADQRQRTALKYVSHRPKKGESDVAGQSDHSALSWQMHLYSERGQCAVGGSKHQIATGAKHHMDTHVTLHYHLAIHE
jgi:hypothetical protein